MMDGTAMISSLGATVYPVALDPSILPLPLVGSLVPAGFPSPADDYLEGDIDLSEYMIARPAATFLMRVSGESMKLAGILDGDLVVVDRSVQATTGDIVVAVLNGDMTIKRFRIMGPGRAALVPENPDFPVFVIGEDMQAELWGVVVGVVRKVRR